ncbi:MAG: hypothetical protein KAQ98_03770 [Bacteriovoracaceae bacterium]|nr:hypothetical protein [Bacteriovoracaceae bacterium]
MNSKLLFSICILLIVTNSYAKSFRITTYNIRNYDKDPRLSIETNKAELIKLIKNTKSDLIAVQEIVNTDDLKKLITKKLPYYQIKLSECGGSARQKLGFIYNKTRLKLVKFNEDLRLSISGRCSSGGRPAAIGSFKIKDSGINFTAISVHLKAGGTQSSADVRAKQYNILSKITAELTGTGRKNVVILGDFNTTDYISENQNYKRFIKFLEKNDFYDFSKNLDCTAYWWGGIEDDLWYGSILDHILATRTFLENFNRETGKTGAHCHKVNCNISTSEELGITFKEVSDHCPVTAQMDY